MTQTNISTNKTQRLYPSDLVHLHRQLAVPRDLPTSKQILEIVPLVVQRCRERLEHRRLRDRLARHDARLRARPPAEHERARDDADRRERHRGAGHHRVQVQAEREEEAHREGDAEHVVDACPDEVPADDGEDGAREVEGGDDVKEVGAYEDDVGGFDGDGGTRGERDTDRGSYERRRVIDTVSNLQRYHQHYSSTK